MQHRRPGRQGQLLGLWVALLLIAGLPAGTRAAAPPAAGVRAPALASIGVTPNAIALTLPLGQSDARVAAVANSADQPLPLAIYEANPPAPAALASTPIPPGLRRAGLPQQAVRLDPQLAAELGAAPGQQADFLVYLADQADLSGAYRAAGWRARGDYVYQTLHDYAEQSQRGLRAALDARGLRYRPLWIVNALLVRGGLADAAALASRGEVALVRANHTTQLPAPPAALTADARCSPDSPSSLVCWNIRRIGADRVWRDFGVTGQGIVLGSIDTGVRYDHPALAAQYRGRLAGGGYDHSYSWFDPHGVSRAPYDSSGHGTHTVGTMAARGDGTAGQPAVGVAPGAQWIAAQGCYGSACSEFDLIASAQWMIAPTDLDGERPRPDLRPMIVSNSWAGEGADSWYAGYVAAWRAAGIVPVFAAGNSGSSCGTIASPGDYANVIGVGATDQNDAIAPFSARGPAADGRRKPDFVAPGAYSGGGAGVLSTGMGDGAPYLALQGTSMATPHVSGLIALLWSANPALIGDYDATYGILRDTARARSDTSCGDPVGAPNSVYGNGRIDAYAAVQRARVDVPWLSVDPPPGPIAPRASASLTIRVDAAKVPGPGAYTAQVLLYGADLTEPLATIPVALTVAPGPSPVTITGRVVSAETGAALLAQVGVRGGLPAATDSTGTYTLTLAAGSYDLVASARSYFAAGRAVTLSADRQLADISLQPDYPYLTSALAGAPTSLAIAQTRTISITIGNQGSQPLFYALRMPADQFAAARSDEPGGPAFSWVDLPASARPLQLSDDGYAESVPLGINFPFYNHIFTDTLVTANGLLAFTLPAYPYVGLSTDCFPDSAFFFYEIAPFRADLDPSSGGSIRFATIDGGATFVLSYEQVPLHGGPAGATYTFQVLLHGDGRITYQYKRLAALPRVLAVGLQRAQIDYQDIGCGPAAAIHDGLAIELRPQPSPAEWLHLADSSGTVAPGTEQTIGATVSWAGPLARTLRARIAIGSNDALRSPITLPVRVDMLGAPHHQWLPLASRAPQ